MVVEKQPGANAASFARAGRQLSFSSACAYADALDYDPRHFSGCYVVKVGQCPVACARNVVIGDCCLCPLPLALGCLPFPFFGACCRQGNHFTLVSLAYRGDLTVIDRERCTLAVYDIRCCSNERRPHPCCLCSRAC